MSEKTIVKQLSSNYKEVLLAGKLTREIQRIMKGKTANRSHEAMTDDEALEVLAKEIYNELKPEYKEHIRFEYLLNLVLSQKKRFLKKNKSKRKIIKKLLK